MQKIIKELEKNSRYLKRIANDSHTVAQAYGYNKAVKDLKVLIKKNKRNTDELIDALNHLDEMADIGSDQYEEKKDLEKSYNFLFNFIRNN